MLTYYQLVDRSIFCSNFSSMPLQIAFGYEPIRHTSKGWLQFLLSLLKYYTNTNTIHTKTSIKMETLFKKLSEIHIKTESLSQTVAKSIDFNVTH